MKKPKVKRSIDICPYIDTSKKVRVYRNLHQGCYSVKQGGLVRVHADNVTLEDVKFIVSKAGQERVRNEKKKNVHAFVEGFVVDSRKADNYVDGDKSDEQLFNGESEWVKLYYNPYRCNGFVNVENGPYFQYGRIAEFAYFAMLDSEGVLAYNISAKCEVCG